MNSPYRVHPALPHQSENTVPFKAKAAAQDSAPGRLQQLLRLEGEVRQQPSWAATVFHALNETDVLLEQSQGFFFRSNNRGHFQCEGASSVAQVDARAPLIAACESVVNRLGNLGTMQALNLHEGFRGQSYPFPHALWLPMKDGRGRAFAGFLMMRASIWPEGHLTIATRLAEAYGFALRVQRPPQLLRQLSLPRWALWGLPVLTVALALIPVPLTTLAPFEVVPRNPMPVTSALDGVVASIAVDPNALVEQGQLLLTLDATALSAERDIAQQRVAVAATKLATARNAAFGDADTKHALATLEKEHELADAELALAQSRLTRTQVFAAEAGVLVYASRSDWLGRPVRVGEKIMDIAKPEDVAVRVDVGVHDSVALPHSESMRLFLDADPLNPLRASVYEKSFHAAERVSGQLSFTVKGRFDDEGSPPRIGMRGTAQLIGQSVPLGFYLLRRPLAALRQQVGL